MEDIALCELPKHPEEETFSNVSDKVNMGSRCGKIYINVMRDDMGAISHMSAHSKNIKPGWCGHIQMQAIQNLVNMALEEGVDISKISGCLEGLTCEENTDGTWERGCTSCPSAIARSLMG